MDNYQQCLLLGCTNKRVGNNYGCCYLHTFLIMNINDISLCFNKNCKNLRHIYNGFLYDTCNEYCFRNLYYRFHQISKIRVIFHNTPTFNTMHESSYGINYCDKVLRNLIN